MSDQPAVLLLLPFALLLVVGTFRGPFSLFPLPSVSLPFLLALPALLLLSALLPCTSKPANRTRMYTCFAVDIASASRTAAAAAAAFPPSIFDAFPLWGCLVPEPLSLPRLTVRQATLAVPPLSM